MNTKYAVHDDQRAHRQHVAPGAVGAAAVAAEDHQARAGHGHRPPGDLGRPGPLAEQRAGHRQHEQRLERADDGGVGDARLLHRAEEQDEVGGEGEPAPERHAEQAAGDAAAGGQEGDGDEAAPSQIR